MRASVVAAGGPDLRVLFKALEDIGTRDWWVLRSAIGDRFMFDPVPDFVVGVLSPTQFERTDPAPEGLTNLDVMLRVGRAVERGLPTLIIAPPPLIINSPVQGATVAHCPLDVEDVLQNHLWAFMTTVSSTSQVHESLGEATRIDPTPFLRAISSINESLSGYGAQVESLVGQVLQQAGAALVENQQRGTLGDRVDFAFVPSADSSGVVLVEAKAGRLSEKRLADAENQLQHYVLSRRAQLGIVVYHDTSDRLYPAPHATPMIVRFSLRELVEKLAVDSLPKVIAAAIADAVGRM